jgi:hypothetical protein
MLKVRRNKKPEPEEKGFPNYPFPPGTEPGALPPVPTPPALPPPQAFPTRQPQAPQPLTPEEAATTIFDMAVADQSPEIWLRTFSNYLHYLANK